MRLDTVVFLMFLVPVSDTKVLLSLRALAAVAQCEAICISDKEEWYKHAEEPKGSHAPQCLEEMDVSVVRRSCAKMCLQTDYEACLQSCKCVHNILESNHTDIPRSAVKGAHLTQPELYCREANILSFKWTSPEGLHPIFITEYRKDGHDSWKTHNKTKGDTEFISGLVSNTRYQIRVRALIRDGQLGPPVTSHWTSTLNDSFIPGTVVDITVHNMTVVNKTLNTIVSWTPSWDRTCFYEVLFWNGRQDTAIVPIHLREKLQLELNNLEFSKPYYFAVRATNHNHKRESAQKKVNFTTPSCLEMLSNPADCPPPMPLGLTVREEDSSTPGLYDIQVKWNISDPLPEYLTVSLNSTIPSPEEGGFLLSHNVIGNTTQTMFPGVPSVTSYRISVVAVSAKGHRSEPAVKKRKQNILPDGYTKQAVEYPRSVLALVTSLCLILAGLTVAIVVGIAYHRQAKRQQLHSQEVEEKKEISFMKNQTIASKQQVTNNYYDAIWEIPSDSLLLGKVLGSGAFGIVRKGVLQQKDGTWVKVAIKTLPNDHTAEDHRHFWQEINMMKNVGCHPHIVNLIGCCTRGSDLQLVVEFCALGDLQDYLRKKWAQMSGAGDYYKTQLSVKYAELSLESSGSEYVGDCSPSLGYCEKWQKKITSIDLLSLARQIAIGMEYLASCRVVHRDLAARNVLLTKECTAKISDFGLSRDIYQENVYRKKGKGLLPVKWMALESLLHQVYTTQSDVWSFGILLWEIVTLGGNPYPGISVNKLFTFLKQGHRMERPSNCSEELYDMMSACWRLKPADRPTFAELHQRLDVLLESSSPQKYLNLNLMTDTNISDSVKVDSLEKSVL